MPEPVRRARQQQALPVLVAYPIPDRGCTDFEQGAPTGEAYEQWIDQLVLALRDERAAVVMEPDAAEL